MFKYKMTNNNILCIYNSKFITELQTNPIKFNSKFYAMIIEDLINGGFEESTLIKNNALKKFLQFQYILPLITDKNDLINYMSYSLVPVFDLKEFMSNEEYEKHFVDVLLQVILYPESNSNLSNVQNILYERIKKDYLEALTIIRDIEDNVHSKFFSLLVMYKINLLKPFIIDESDKAYIMLELLMNKSILLSYQNIYNHIIAFICFDFVILPDVPNINNIFLEIFVNIASGKEDYLLVNPLASENSIIDLYNEVLNDFHFCLDF